MAHQRWQSAWRSDGKTKKAKTETSMGVALMAPYLGGIWRQKRSGRTRAYRRSAIVLSADSGEMTAAAKAAKRQPNESGENQRRKHQQQRGSVWPSAALARRRHRGDEIERKKQRRQRHESGYLRERKGEEERKLKKKAGEKRRYRRSGEEIISMKAEIKQHQASAAWRAASMQHSRQYRQIIIRPHLLIAASRVNIRAQRRSRNSNTLLALKHNHRLSLPATYRCRALTATNTIAGTAPQTRISLSKEQRAAGILRW